METTATERWGRLSTLRQAILTRTRTLARLTIPALLPPEGANETTILYTPYQSQGARGVNNIASKLLLALFPPGQAFFRMQIDPKVRLELQAAQQLDEAMQKLAEYEQAVGRKFETTNYRPTLFETIKHLVVVGNALLHQPKKGMRMFRLDQYAVRRHPDGTPAEVVIKEEVDARSLKPEVKAACKISDDHKECVSLYTVIEWREGREYEWQELNSSIVPDSQADRPTDKGEWLPLRWQAVPTSSYGRGLCEEYMGDLMSLEGLSESMVMFAAAAAKIVYLVHPASTTKWQDIVKARSGDAITGSKTDVDVLQLDKYADFQVTKSLSDELTLRLSQAFLLQSGTVRNAERVTAEEIRATAQELEDALGGVYTVQSVELQLPIVRKVIQFMTSASELPALPPKFITPVITTGFEALGRNQSVNKLRSWITDVKQSDPSGGASLKWDQINRRLGVGYGVDDLDQLIKSPEEVAHDQQQQQMAQLMSKAGPGIATEAMKASMKNGGSGAPTAPPAAQ